MTRSLETAAPAAVAQGLRRVAIDPLSRVEGHGKVTILLDGQNRVQQVRLSSSAASRNSSKAGPTGRCR
jgi:NAD-reducing hydrogenase large subunit